MKRKIWLWLLLVLIVILMTLTRRPIWPKQEELPKTAKLQKQCKIIRDKWDVPHITAASDEAGFYCWGLAQATDRTWQMDFLRRTAYGKMAEMYGFSYIKQDFFFRLLDITGVAKRLTDRLAKQSPETYRLLRFFVWGVNDAFQKTRLTPYHKRPYNLREGQELEPWRLQDTMVVMMLQSFFQTNKSFLDDLAHARMRVVLGEERYNLLYEGDKNFRLFDESIIKAGEHPLVPLPASKKAAPASRPAVAPASRPTSAPLQAPSSRPSSVPYRPLPPKTRGSLLRALNRVLAYIPKLGEIGEGSNNWVVNASRGQNGYAMLANDPHLRITVPSFWHEAHIRTPHYNAMGVAVPGGPFVISGNNEHVSWGVTNGYTNVADLIAVKVDRQGRFNIGKKAYQSKHITPTVYGRVGPLYLPIFWQRFRTTELGPILPIRWPGEKLLLLRWSGLSVQKHPYPHLLELLRAKSVQEADSALRKIQNPCFNMVFADTKGQIGYRQVGLLPRRLHGRRGLLNGDDKGERWDGFLKPSESPALLNPKRGFIATANNRTFPGDYPFFTGDAFVVGFRAKRIEQMIQARPKHTMESFQAIQNDSLVPAATILLGMMLNQLHQALGKDILDPLTSEAIRTLQRWDRRAELHQVGPTIFRTWLADFEIRAFKKDRVAPPTAAILRALRGEIKPSVKESIPTLLKISFETAVKRLRQKLGPNIKTWQWRRFHTITFEHLLNTAQHWNPPALPIAGDTETVSPALSIGKGPFHTKVMASYRLVAEMKPGRVRTWGVLAGRQLDKLPTKFSEQAKLWSQGKLRPRPFYPDEIQKHKKQEQTVKF